MVAAVAALLIGACDGPAIEHSDSPKLDIPSPTLADKTGDAMRIATAADDTAITAKVTAAVSAEAGLQSPDISIGTRNAIVTLSGSVDSAKLNERAKQIAASTPGVRAVVDQLVLKTPS
jgi:osmotically-inducible protein OsmY